MDFSDFEDINLADPFSDRKHGPRTRSRSFKGDDKAEGGRGRTPKRSEAFLSDDPLPTHSSFAKLAPAAFPSLDPRSTVKQAEQCKAERELQRRAEHDYNPFEAGFFTRNHENQQQTGLLSYEKAHLQQQQSGDESAEVTVPSTPPFPAAETIRQEAVVEESIHYYRREGQDPYLYETFLTKHPTGGKVVKWHQRASRTRKQANSEVDGGAHSRDSPRTSATPGLAPDEDIESESDRDPQSPPDLGQDCNVDHRFLDNFVRRAFESSDNMTENVAPATSSDDATRGMPYYDRLKKTLKTSIKQKQELDETLAKIEQSIWNKEAAYLDETVAGNIMKGFDNYIKASGAPGSSLTGGGTASRKKATVSEQDRLFSKSSVGFWNSMREGSPHASATSTPSHAPTPKGLSDHPTPTSATSTKGPGFKKKKMAEKDDESDGKPNKRLKITFSRTDKD